MSVFLCTSIWPPSPETLFLCYNSATKSPKAFYVIQDNSSIHSKKTFYLKQKPSFNQSSPHKDQSESNMFPHINAADHPLQTSRQSHLITAILKSMKWSKTAGGSWDEHDGCDWAQKACVFVLCPALVHWRPPLSNIILLLSRLTITAITRPSTSTFSHIFYTTFQMFGGGNLKTKSFVLSKAALI